MISLSAPGSDSCVAHHVLLGPLVTDASGSTSPMPPITNPGYHHLWLVLWHIFDTVYLLIVFIPSLDWIIIEIFTTKHGPYKRNVHLNNSQLLGRVQTSKWLQDRSTACSGLEWEGKKKKPCWYKKHYLTLFSTQLS